MKFIKVELMHNGDPLIHVLHTFSAWVIMETGLGKEFDCMESYIANCTWATKRMKWSTEVPGPYEVVRTPISAILSSYPTRIPC